MTLGKCATCKIRDAVAVAAIPGVPMSEAICAECAEGLAIPYFACVANTACCGGREHTNAEWREIIAATIAINNKTIEEFDADVAKDIKLMDEYEPPRAEGEPPDEEFEPA